MSTHPCLYRHPSRSMECFTCDKRPLCLEGEKQTRFFMDRHNFRVGQLKARGSTRKETTHG